MRIPNKLLLYTIFNNKAMLSSLIDVTESMWPPSDRNIDHLYELIRRAASSYFGCDIYPTINEKVANILYVIAKNHDFENGNKRTAIVVSHTTMMVNGIYIIIEPDELYHTVIEVVESAPRDKDSVIAALSNQLKSSTKSMPRPFDNETLEKISDIT